MIIGLDRQIRHVTVGRGGTARKVWEPINGMQAHSDKLEHPLFHTFLLKCVVYLALSIAIDKALSNKVVLLFSVVSWS